MKHILFVDDEPLALQGLQRVLRHMRTEWDMAFVDSGKKAIAHMTQRPVDVIVSDMRMPGMNGAELLNIVMQRHPQTIRLILSGYADQHLVSKCIGATHQYLTKPCDPNILKETIQRVVALEKAVLTPELKQLINRMERMPSLPSLYISIITKAQDPNINLAEIGELIAQDIGMTANILKLVNSAFFSLSVRVADPKEAVLYLGVETVKSLVLAIKAYGQLLELHLPGLNANALWQHSMQTGVFARNFARERRVPRIVVEQSFVAGMLHDIGKLILSTRLPTQYTEVLKMQNPADHSSWLVAEQTVLGATHPDVGAYLLGLWGLPVPVVEAVALHHKPPPPDTGSFSPLLAVQAANEQFYRLLAAGKNPPH
jgi:HD-like signal output (HDOD) protein/CheY-like chemotaxis protein